MDNSSLLYKRIASSAVSADSAGQVILYNGKAYIYNVLGSWVRTDEILPKYLQGSTQVGALSILVTRRAVTAVPEFEIGVSIGRVFKAFTVRGITEENFVSVIYASKGFITSLSRKDIVDGRRFTQWLYIYQAEIDIVGILRSLMGQYGFTITEVKR